MSLDTIPDSGTATKSGYQIDKNNPYLFDLIPTPTFAWSTHQMNAGLVRAGIVRRSSDSVTQDVTYDNQTRNINSITQFAGSSDVFITTLYNQGNGGAMNAFQNTATNQPIIFQNRKFITTNGSPPHLKYFTPSANLVATLPHNTTYNMILVSWLEINVYEVRTAPSGNTTIPMGVPTKYIPTNFIAIMFWPSTVDTSKFIDLVRLYFRKYITDNSENNIIKGYVTQLASGGVFYLKIDPVIDFVIISKLGVVRANTTYSTTMLEVDDWFIIRSTQIKQITEISSSILTNVNFCVVSGNLKNLTFGVKTSDFRSFLQEASPFLLGQDRVRFEGLSFGRFFPLIESPVTDIRSAISSTPCNFFGQLNVNNTSLETITFPNCQFDSVGTFIIGSALKNVNLNASAIPTAGINQILIALDTAGATNGLVDLRGTNMGITTGTGLTARTSLIAKGWRNAVGGTNISNT